ncbi:MAG: tetratricopeptide repeat-containing glycosyltransferase family protein [Rhodospirillales bacterium]|jgi:tetratricopeptide (TPR) repeat protein|nr:tetratricopeptide repeat-containing glycosyltransferase family protein [Rhodospirillales bacterium]MDP6645398.1 tetratricopeptide repeat-containing glycosyltransferase family protein [Rhodospirillales bacterium]
MAELPDTADDKPDARTEISEQLSDAVRLHQDGRFDEAIVAYQAVLETSPEDATALSSLGVAMRAGGRGGEALEILTRGAGLHPDNADLNYNLGNALRDAGDAEAAITRYRKVLELNPGYLGAATNLALALNGLGRNREAAEVCTKALVLHPFQAELHTNLGVAHWYLEEHRAAVACYRRSIALNADNAQTLYNLGLALETCGEHDAAAGCLKRAVGLQPKSADYLSGLGQSLISLGDIPRAMELFNHALAQDGDNLDAHLGVARANLLAGNLAAGFEEYEWHHRRKVNPVPDLPGSAWDGSDPAGKTILVYGEQGIGDTIQNARYIPMLAARGATVILRCHKSLIRLFGTLEGTQKIVDQDAPAPDFDAHVPVMDLPKLFGTSLDTIPADCPYLAPPEGTEFTIPKQVFRIGIVGAGSREHQKNRTRSFTLDHLAPLFEIPGLIVFSLQTGDAAKDIAASELGRLVRDVGSELTDFAHTADVLQQLDLLITADTAIAHLAGALALPVWTLLPFAPDWRWLLRRDDSPWYPTMRLFRQPAPLDWDGAIKNVADALARAAAEKREAEEEGD